MQINKTNNIIFLKNAESNIIDEALVVLKKNVHINECNSEENKKGQFEEKNILKEAEILVNEKIAESNLYYEKYIMEKLKKKNKFLKIVNILLIITSLISIIIKN